MRRAVNRFFPAFLAVPNRAEFSANAIALSAVHLVANVVQRWAPRGLSLTLGALFAILKVLRSVAFLCLHPPVRGGTQSVFRFHRPSTQQPVCSLRSIA